VCLALGEDDPSTLFFGLEIIEQQTPSFPALQPIGIFLFLVASVAAGVLILRKSQ